MVQDVFCCEKFGKVKKPARRVRRYHPTCAAHPGKAPAHLVSIGAAHHQVGSALAGLRDAANTGLNCPNVYIT